MATKNCKPCLGEHDEEIHEATVRLHQWFRLKVIRYLTHEDDEMEPTAA